MQRREEPGRIAMTVGNGLIIDLAELKGGPYGLVPELGAFLGKTASVSFHTQGHGSGVEMKVTDRFTDSRTTTTVHVQWDAVTQRDLQCFADLAEAAEHGAYGVAILLICKMTGLCIRSRSPKGTGIDYWLGPEGGDDEYPFQNVARLEVSGTGQHRQSEVSRRVRIKEKQTDRSAYTHLPAYVVVVDFPTPASHVVKR